MKAIVKGQFLKIDSYHSTKQGKDIFVLVLFDGDEAIRIDNYCPSTSEPLNLGDFLEVSVKVYSGQYGLRVCYSSSIT